MSILKKYRELRSELTNRKLRVVLPKGGIEAFDRDKVMREHEGIKEHMEDAQTFIIEDVISMHSDEAEGLDNSLSAMVQAGVWDLPFDRCVFLMPLEYGEGRFLAATLTIKCDGQEGLPDVRAVSYFFVRRDWDDGWMHVPVQGYFEPANGHIYVRCVTGHKNVKDDLEFFKQTDALISECMWAVNTCVVLMSTTGITVERRHTRTKLKYRDRPEYSYHQIVIPGVTGGGHDGRTIGERKRVRLHMRRGFVRKNQPYGPGGLGRKPALVRPALVGYEEEGQVFKTYEVRAEERMKT